ncbi:MAG: hypothetical protein MUP04_04015 [Anaerolineae bacterium]|nr:hypothetical protein [Anaerolineae bacterium]
MDETKELLTWLDEEQRREKALLQELRKQAEDHAAHIEDLVSRFGELEGRLTRLQGQIAQLPSLDETLSRVRAEASLVVHEAREERRRAEEQAAALRQRERESVAQALEKVREEITFLLGKKMEPLEFHRSELQRLSEAIAGLRQEISGPREESIAQGRKIEYLESRVDKSTQEIAELGLMREEIRKEREGFLEEWRRLKDERQKEIAELRRDRAAWLQELSKREEETPRLEERIKEATKLSASLDKLEKELRVRRDQLLHLQRLGEERLKGQLEEWRKENEKRWANSAADWERQKEEEAKRKARLVVIWPLQLEHARRQMAELERWIEELAEEIKRLKGSG